MTERRLPPVERAVDAPSSRGGRWLDRLSVRRPLPRLLFALGAVGGLGAAYGLAHLWPSPPWMPVIVTTALLAFLAAGLAGLLFAVVVGAPFRAATKWRLIASVLLALAWLAACRWVLFECVPHWLWNQGSRQAVTTIRPADGGGPVFDIYRVTDGRPQLTVRRWVSSELVHEAEEGGDFADFVDAMVHGHHLVFDPGGASRDRSATIDGRPAIIESRY